METQSIDNSTSAEGYNFTPRFGSGRVKMRISEDDHAIVLRRIPGLRGIATDLDTGKRYKVYGRSCGLPNCDCDAEIKEIK